MHYLNQHISIAEQLLDDFLSEADEKVLSRFLKQYFKYNRKYGKRDRFQISESVYWMIRKQLFGLDQSIERLMRDGMDSDPLDISVENQSKFLSKLRSIKLTTGIQSEDVVSRYFSDSHTFFVAGDGVTVPDTIPLVEGVPYVPVGRSISDILESNKFYVQDISSQKVWQNIDISGTSLWDACAGAGGKSLSIYKDHRNLKIYASDKRKTSLRNLLHRFAEMGWPEPEVFRADLSEPKKVMPFENVDTIVCDVPCSGSATWHRAPENALLFNPEYLATYQNTQRSIVRNCLPMLKKDGLLIYITCSIWAIENEMNIKYFESELGLSLVTERLVNYFEFGGDALYVAVMKRLSPQ